MSASREVRVPIGIRKHSLLLVLTAVLTLPLYSQINTATIVGRVTDPSGATIPDADVSVESVATGTTRQAKSNSDGVFSVPSLQPGEYNLTVTKSGFSTAKEPNVQLAVNQTANLTIALQVGQTSQSVEVTSSAPLLETATAGLGTVVQTKEIVELPLNGRQFTQLLQLAPGTAPVDVSQNSYTRPSLGSGPVTPSVNGQTNRSNLFFIDGVFATDPFFSGFSMSPGVDAIQEFKENTHADQAEFGQATGGTVNLATKSGTNQFHGTAYEFLRNDVLDARNFFQQVKGAYKQNQFGGTVGGPVLKNKLFFFAEYDGYRAVQAATNFTIVPTTAQLAGDFSALSTPIYDPATYNAATKTISQFPGNVIPNGRLNQGALSVLHAYVPAPNYFVPGSANNYLNTASQTWNQDQGGIRGDYMVGSNDTINGHYLINEETNVQPSSLPLIPFTVGFNGKNAGVNWVHTFSPTLVSQLTLGYNSIDIPQSNEQPNAGSLFTSAGFDAGFTPTPGGVGVPLIPGQYPSQGYASVPTGWGPIGPQYVSQYSGSVAKTAGAHNLKFGASFYQTWMYTNWSQDSENYTQQATWNPVTQTGGDSLASELLGLPNNASRQLGNSGVSLRMHMFGVFAEDSWKITPKLTLNYGLRWDYSSPVNEKFNRLAGFDIQTGNWYLPRGDVDAPSTLPAGVVTLPRSTITTPNYDNYGPRLGFAYQIAPKTVIRAGAGIFYDNWAGVLQTSQNARGAWPTGTNQSVNNLNIAGLSPGVTTQNPFVGVPPVLPSTPFPSGGGFQDTRWKDAYSSQWNFQIQQQLWSSATLSLSYVGSQSNRIPIQVPWNLAFTPGPGPVGGSRVPFPMMSEFQVIQSISRASYNSFQAQFNQQYSNGLSYTTAFTWSKTIDIGCADNWEACNIQNPYNLNQDRGPSALDVPFVFTLSGVYELPFGKGKRFINGGLTSWLLGGWQVNGIFVARSGTTYTPSINFDNANTGGNNNGEQERPNLVGNPNLSNPTPNLWFNPNAFAVPPLYSYGNAGRNILRGPHYVDTDFSLFRTFPIRERLKLQFRAEFFNIFNHPNFSNPSATLGNANFGVVTSQAGNPRLIQGALRLSY